MKKKLDEDKTVIVKLNDEIASTRAQNTIVAAEVAELENRLTSKSSTIEELENELRKLNSTSKSAAQQSQDLTRLKIEHNKEMKKLLDEIDLLKETVCS